VFRDLHRPGQPLILPNAWDFASGAVLADAGFRAIGTTSLGVAAAHGIADGAGLARAETLAVTARLVRLPCMVTVDIEGGFSDDPAEVAAYAGALADLGAVGINLEDGRPDGVLAPVELHRAKIRAVRERAPALFVNARTDVHWLGAGDDAIERCRAYVEAGAQGVFVPGLRDPDAIGRLVSAVDAPLNVLYSPAGPSVAQCAALGVARISCGSLLFRAALKSTVDAAVAVRDGAGGVGGDAPSYAEVTALVERADHPG
jgi:2-methylisocitrate lyase-like PEP mutase family enzyme